MLDLSTRFIRESYIYWCIQRDLFCAVDWAMRCLFFRLCCYMKNPRMILPRKACLEIVKFETLWMIDLSVELSIRFIRDGSSIDALSHMFLCCLSHEMCHHCLFLKKKNSSEVTNPPMITTQSLVWSCKVLKVMDNVFECGAKYLAY